MAELATGFIVIAGAFGLLAFLLGALVAIEASTSGTEANSLAAADQWMRQAQIWLGLTPARVLGSYAMSLGIKVSAGALAAAIPLDIMYSLRAAGEYRRR